MMRCTLPGKIFYLSWYFEQCYLRIFLIVKYGKSSHSSGDAKYRVIRKDSESK